MCNRGGLNPEKSRKGRYIPGNVYNQMKEIFIKDWKEKKLLGVYSSGYIPNLNNHQIKESNIKCETCTRQLWNYMQNNSGIEKLHIIVKDLT